MDFYNTDNMSKFIEGKLSSIDKEKFEEALKDNEFLRDAVDGMRMMIKDGVDIDDLYRESKKNIERIKAKKMVRVKNPVNIQSKKNF